MRTKAQEYADSIKSGDYVHQNADVTASFFAPVVKIPQDIFDAEQRYIKVDLGKLTVGNDLQLYNKDKDYKLETDE